MLNLIWSTPTRKTLTSTCAAIAAIFGVITGGPNALEAWDDMSLPTFATRGWVRVQYAPQTTGLKAIQLDIANGKREAAEARRDKLELDLLGAKSEEEKVKNLQLQRREKETLDKIDAQIKAINGK